MDNKPETAPDELLDTFRGRGLTSIIVFTIVAHLVLLLGTSVPWMLKTFLGQDNAGLSEEERTELAVKEAKARLREIADEHGIKPQDLSSQMAGGSARIPTPAAPDADAATPTPDAEAPAPGESGEPPSAIEQELEKVEEGPAVPPIEEEVDLFK